LGTSQLGRHQLQMAGLVRMRSACSQYGSLE
jgi:hypothetical protein